MVSKSDERRTRLTAEQRNAEPKPTLVARPEKGVPGFGELLRRYRLRAGLSQAALAERANLSERAISDLERGIKARPQAATLGLLTDALALATDEHEQLIAAARRGAATHPASPPPLLAAVPEVAAHNLPPALTRFIGREQDIAASCRLLDEGTPLITLTGSGGSGKTRLALEIARGSIGNYPNGVWLVELAGLADPALVPSTIAHVLGVREAAGQTPTEALRAGLRTKRLLLVLDNCEHLLDACAATVAALLDAAPGIRIVATSRQALQIDGESIRRVPALTLPTTDEQHRREEFLASEAAQLLLDRVAAQGQDFTLRDDDIPALAAICRKLDGMPLALELVAARIATVGVAPVAARLDRALDLLASARRAALPRHQTLRATFDWSYQLLAPDEAALLDRLAVFAGGWSAAAAEAIDDQPASRTTRSETIFTLAQLVEKSLVLIADGRDEPRYHLPETLRQYAWDRLRAAGLDATTRDRHAAYFCALGREASGALGGAQQVAWGDRLERDHDNLRAALHWLRERGDAAAGLALIIDLWAFWFRRGYAQEGRGWADAFLALAGEAHPSLRARVLLHAAFLAFAAGEQADSQTYLSASRDLFAALGETDRLAYLHNAQGILDEARGDGALAQERYAEALRLADETSDAWTAAAAALNLAEYLRAAGAIDAAERHYAASVGGFRELGDLWGIAAALTGQGDVARLRGHFVDARRHYGEAVGHFRAINFRQELLMALAGLALVVAAEGKTERAIHLCAAIDALAARLGVILWTAKQAEFDRCVAALREATPPRRFAAAWAAGAALTLDAAIEEALREGPSTGDPALGDRPPERPSTSPTPLIGRDEALATAAALITEEGATLLTIIGPGGVGKTRFGLALAERLRSRYRDGTAVVGLAALQSAHSVPQALAQALGIAPQPGIAATGQLMAYLQQRAMLILLDNAEHLLDVAPFVEHLLAHCPALTIVTTSRAPLRLRREREFPLSPLALPAGRALATISAAPAVQLLVALARALRPDFALTATNAPELAAICRQVDGLPLALELAATRLRVFDPATLLAGLTDRTVALRSTAADRPERHKTIQRLIGWSYDLLSPQEQRLFRCLGTFHGGATLDALGTVAGLPGASSIEAAESLVAHSLVRLETPADAAPRLVPLELLREFALEQLLATGEADAARSAHAAHLLDALSGAEDGVLGRERAHWQSLLAAEEENIRAALAHLAEQGDAETGLQLCWLVWRFWSDRGQGDEACAWFDRFLALGGAGELRAQCLFAAGLSAVWRFADADAQHYLLQCHALSLHLGLWRWEAAALTQLGHLARRGNDLPLAASRYAGALDLRRQFGDQREIALSLLGLGHTTADLGDLERGESQLIEALTLLRAWGDASEEANTLSYLADLAGRRGDAATARAHLTASLDLWWNLGAHGRLFPRLLALAERCAATAPTETLRLLGAMQAAERRLGLLPAAGSFADQQRLIGELHDRLGPATAATAWDDATPATPTAITTLAAAMIARHAEANA